MFSRWLQKTSARMISERGRRLNLPESASRMGMDVTRASEPSETKPERQIRNRQMQTAMRSCQNASGISTPMEVATALPPLKPRKQE